jgi:peptidyl-prolyl cis-trans isomerase D
VNKLNSILGAAVVFAIIVVFIIQFRPATGPQRDNGPTCAAEVKGACISSSHFWASYYLLTARGADQNFLRANNFRRAVTDGLIETYLLNQDAKRLKIAISDEDITAEVAAGRAHVSLPSEKVQALAGRLGVMSSSGDLVSPLIVKDRKSKRFDAKAAEKDIRRRTRLSPEEFRDYQRSELIAARMRALIRSRVQVSEAEAYEEFARLKSTAQVEYVRFDRNFYADMAVDTSPKAVEAWAAMHKDEVEKAWDGRKGQLMPECRVTRHVLVKVDATATDELKAEKKKRIERALERINKGEDFAEVARAMSDDTSASRGGDLGCVAKGTMVKPFEDGMLALPEGKVSPIVETEYGYHVLKVEKIAKDAEAEKIGRAQVALDTYLGSEADRVTAEASKSVLAAVQGGKSLKDALDTHLQELEKKRDAEKKADKNAKKADAKKADAKKADAKKADAKGEPGKTDDNAAATAADDLHDANGDNKPLTVATHPRRPIVETSPTFSAAGGSTIPGVVSEGELTNAVFALGKPGDAVSSVVPLESGYAVATLKERKQATREQFDKEGRMLVEQMRAVKEGDALTAYLKRLHDKLASDVVYKKEIVDEPKVKPGEEQGSDPEPFEE